MGEPHPGWGTSPAGAPPGASPQGKPPLVGTSLGDLTWGPHLRRGPHLGGLTWGPCRGSQRPGLWEGPEVSWLRPETPGEASGTRAGLFLGPLTPTHFSSVGLGVGAQGPRALQFPRDRTRVLGAQEGNSSPPATRPLLGVSVPGGLALSGQASSERERRHLPEGPGVSRRLQPCSRGAGRASFSPESLAETRQGRQKKQRVTRAAP